MLTQAVNNFNCACRVRQQHASFFFSSAGHLKGRSPSTEPHSNLHVIGLCGLADYLNRNSTSQFRWWESGVCRSARVYITKHVDNRSSGPPSKGDLTELTCMRGADDSVVGSTFYKNLCIFIHRSNSNFISNLNWKMKESPLWLILLDHTKGWTQSINAVAKRSWILAAAPSCVSWTGSCVTQTDSNKTSVKYADWLSGWLGRNVQALGWCSATHKSASKCIHRHGNFHLTGLSPLSVSLCVLFIMKSTQMMLKQHVCQQGSLAEIAVLSDFF